MHRAVAGAVQIVGAEPDPRLALAEFLLSNVDIQASARRAIDWLAAHTSVKQAVVALVDANGSHLQLVAEHNVSSSAIVDFIVMREDEAHPLVQALDRVEPSYFDGAAPTFRSPLEGRFHAIPLRSEDTPIAHGLLLASSTGPDLHPEVGWLAKLLSKQISRLMSRQTLAETRQERMLLYSIINAVTDPILLTDTEGKLIIANTHAEKLFAAPEDASEGWRRAVALNNMLFSAALSTSAVADIELAPRV